MKRAKFNSRKTNSKFFILLMLFLIFVAETALSSPEWVVEEITSTTANLRSTDLVLDSTDKPNIAFIAGNRLILAVRNLDTWDLDTLVQSNASSVSIDMFSTDTPAIVYSHISTPGEFKYMYFDGYTWQKETIDEIWDATEACLSIDTRDIPTILYMQFVCLNPSVANTDLFLYKRGATEWEYNSILSYNSMAEGTVNNLDLDLIDFTDEPRALYRLFSNGKYTLEYAWQDSPNWESLTLDQEPEYENSIDVDVNGVSHCSYRINSNLCYAVGDNRGFTQEVVDTADSVAMYKDVQGDSSSVPHIVYDSPDGLKYATKTESGWEFATIGPLNSSIRDPKICIDSSGTLHVVWVDIDRHKVMYAYYGELSSASTPHQF